MWNGGSERREVPWWSAAECLSPTCRWEPLLMRGSPGRELPSSRAACSTFKRQRIPRPFRAGETLTLNPRKGTNDKKPWSKLDLATLEGQTIEAKHVHNVYLGETLAPYVTLDPLRAVLPVKRGEFLIHRDRDGEFGIDLGGLEWRMRDRWRTISGLWDSNKASANKLKLVERLDYHGEFSAQFAWQEDPQDRPVRVVYSSAGVPTAAVLANDQGIVDYKLFWITCRNMREANYLLAVINSMALYSAASPLMSKGLWGARDLQKHLWKLPIPRV